MKLYGHSHSCSTRQVLLTLAEKGAAAELRAIEPLAGEQERPTHLARHPFGRLPVLEHGAFLLYEAQAIMRYLDAVLPGPLLVPADVRERARMDQWLSVESAYVAPAIARLTTQLVTGPVYGVAPDAVEIADARQELRQALAVLDRALLGRAQLVGDAPSLADVVHLASVCTLFELRQGDLVRAHPHLLRWWHLARARPSWCALLAASDAPAPWARCASPSRPCARARSFAEA